MVSPARTAVVPWTGSAEEPRYWELVPLFPLPELDLSVSVKSRCIRNRSLHRMISVINRSPLTFLAYMTAIVLIVTVLYVPAHMGQILGVLSLLGTPGAVVSVLNLRFEMVVVMATTLDMWFAAAVSTLFSIALGLLFRDARAAVVLVAWLGFVTNFCVDASVSGLRHIWIANVTSIVSYVAVLSAVSAGITDETRAMDLVRVNGHALATDVIVRECLTTVTIVVLRNVLRKHTRAVEEKQTATKWMVFRCVSFRCRLQLRVATEQARLQSSPRLNRPNWQTFTDHTVAVTKTKLRFVPELPVLDAQHSVVHITWLWQHQWTRIALLWRWIGLAGVVLVELVLIVRAILPTELFPWLHLPVVMVGASATILFTGVSIALSQRQLFWAVVASFDCLYVTYKFTMAHISIAALLQWHPTTTLALGASLQWWFWILFWDALPPPARQRLGLSPRLAASIAFSVVAVVAIVIVVVVVVKPPETFGDPLLFRIRVGNHAFDFHAFSWLLSSVVTVFPWVLRILWRLGTACETDMIVLDGTVVYENQKPAKQRGPGKPPRRDLDDPRPRNASARSFANVVAVAPRK